MKGKEKTSRGNDGEKEDKGKRANGSNEWKDEGAVKKMRRGLKALKEIKLIRRLQFQRVI